MPQPTKSPRKVRPRQKQKQQPGLESKLSPRPRVIDPSYSSSGKLFGKVALITGGDSGIGRAVAVLFAKEGADVAIVYLNEHEDAKATARLVEETGRKAFLYPCDIGSEKNCQRAVKRVFKEFKRLDILVNNAAVQFPRGDIRKITRRQLERTFQVNIYAMFYLVKAAAAYLKKGSCIINTASVTAYRGSPTLLDYSASKGAIISFTRSLAHSLMDKQIRVNAVAPGPVWTPLIAATFPADKVALFGSDVPMARAGQPAEIAQSYLFLASNAGSYMSGQVLHPNGGEIVNG